MPKSVVPLLTAALVACCGVSILSGQEGPGQDPPAQQTEEPMGSPTVVVTINDRLGLFGFLAHPALNDEDQ